MRVAIVSTQYIRVPPQGYGGTELFCGNLASALAARGHEVTLFATGDSEAPCEVRALYPQALWPGSEQRERWHVRWAIEQIASASVPYDAVQANSPYALDIGQKLSVPVFYTIHHAREARLSAIYAEHPEATFIAISERQRELEVTLPSATVIHHGLPEASYPVSLRHQGYLLHLGRFCHQKGTHLAIDAARAAGIPIVLAGRYHDEDEAYFYKEVLPRLGLGGVAYCGEADHARKVALLGGALALLCPIQWEEPFGLAAVEGMLSGTPVVGYARGSFPEILDEGVTGTLVGSFDELVAAVKTIDQTIDRAACAAQARARFSVDRMAACYERIFLARGLRTSPVRASGG